MAGLIELTRLRRPVGNRAHFSAPRRRPGGSSPLEAQLPPCFEGSIIGGVAGGPWKTPSAARIAQIRAAFAAQEWEDAATSCPTASGANKRRRVQGGTGTRALACWGALQSCPHAGGPAAEGEPYARHMSMVRGAALGAGAGAREGISKPEDRRLPGRIGPDSWGPVCTVSYLTRPSNAQRASSLPIHHRPETQLDPTPGLATRASGPSAEQRVGAHSTPPAVQESYVRRAGPAERAAAPRPLMAGPFSHGLPCRPGCGPSCPGAPPATPRPSKSPRSRGHSAQTSGRICVPRKLPLDKARQDYV